MRHKDSKAMENAAAGKRATSHARVFVESLASMRAVAAFRGITVAELIDELLIPQLPCHLELRGDSAKRRIATA